MNCRILAAALLLALAAGCNSNPSSGGSSTVVAKNSTGQLVGAGSTFIYPVMSQWIDTFQRQSNGVRINYQSIGSGGGIQQLKQGLVDFGASDAALDDKALTSMPPLLQIPESAGPVCITYNLTSLKQPLRLTPKALAGIFLGNIKSWTDPEIANANPGVALPKATLLVVHRSDGSGTTNIFTTYLSTISPEWQKKVGANTSVAWPSGLGGKGSEGVTGVVKQSPGAIGYVELIYALDNKLPVALVENAAGKFLAPTAQGASAAIAAFADKLAQDVRTPIVDPPASAPDAYPISGLTFLMIDKDGNDSTKREEVKHFVQYVITDGQQAADALHYSPLPPALVDQDQKLLAEMTVNGKPLP